MNCSERPYESILVKGGKDAQGGLIRIGFAVAEMSIMTILQLVPSLALRLKPLLASIVPSASSSSASTPAREHVPALTGMRGAASLYVLFYHMMNFGIFPAAAVFEFGWSGVQFFFVLSGYLLGRLYDAPSLRYFVRRVFRTFGLYYVTIPLFVAAGLVAFSPVWIVYGQNLSRSTFADLPQWTLIIEEQFYFLVLPLLLLLRKRLGPSWLFWFGVFTVASAVLSVAWDSYFLARFGFDVSSDFGIKQMPSYLVDYLLGFTVSGLPTIKGRGKFPLQVLVLSLFAGSLFWFGGFSDNALAPLVLGGVFCLLILAFSGSRLFSNRLAVTLGSWSYGIYLIQLPLLALLGVWGVPLTFLLAALSFRFFEFPLMRLGSRLV